MLTRLLKRARDRNRTDTFLRTADFESAASTNSATRAKKKSKTIIEIFGWQYYAFHIFYPNQTIQNI